MVLVYGFHHDMETDDRGEDFAGHDAECDLSRSQVGFNVGISFGRRGLTVAQLSD